jgi:DNA-binding transcriptional regulator YhcF (GntR family)
MRGKDYNTGLRGVLFEARHYQRMGSALWLYGWLVLRQTHQQGDVGWVLGGSPISYREIEEETGFNCRTLERWMHTLRANGYVETQAAPAGIIVRIAKAKKFSQGARSFADRARKSAAPSTQACGANEPDLPQNQRAAAAIRSSSLEQSQEKRTAANARENFHGEEQSREHRSSQPDPSFLGRNQTWPTVPEHDFNVGAHLEQQRKFLAEARLRLQLLRAEREEAVRRELRVGTGPEVRRP